MKAAIAAAMAITASLIVPPARAASIVSYPWTASARVTDADGGFSVYVHQHQDLLMLQPRWGEIFTRVPGQWPIEVWRRAAEAFVAPLGCGVPDIHAMGLRSAGTWEASYVCPPGVDLRALVKAQHDALMRGESLKP